MDTPKLYQWVSGAETGAFNMALDETLLEWARSLPTPALIVRTYGWCAPTLSYGVHQREQEILKLLKSYSPKGGSSITAVVRRPTGGRAILHDKDISFSFITNCPEICQMSLKESYGFLMGFVRRTLNSLGVSLTTSNASDRGYTLSPLCFETETPSDLLDVQGKKVAGCSQLRRNGGILQHGAAFLTPHGVSRTLFSQALFQEVACYYGQKHIAFLSFKKTEWESILYGRIEELCRESAGILEKASTTTGSHLKPASC